MKALLNDLLDSDRAKHNTLDDLQGIMESVRSSIVTRDMFDDLLNNKARFQLLV